MLNHSPLLIHCFRSISKLEVEIENHCLYADKNMIDVVIRNLVANAIKFTKKEGKIKIYAVPSEHGLRTYIEDDGMGIPKSRIDSLFTENVISTEGSDHEIGTGLGLMLCKQYIELNKGKIGVESEEGKGSTFWFELPLYEKV